MPFTSVSLIAPADDCEGGLGDGFDVGGVGIGGGGIGGGDPEIPIYPSAEFVPVNCCFIADFNLACQEYTKNCAVLATIQTDISAKFEYYRRRIPYLLDGNDPVSCPCELIQSNLVSEQTIHKAWWLERHRLVALRVHVGKIRVQCEGGESACKYYVAVSYIFEHCEFVLGWDASGVTFYPEFTNTYDCTGVYRDGTCSFSNQFENTSTINNCNDLLEEFPAQFCNEFQQKIISRIKIFDTLPTGQISISDADYPPLSCCGGSTGCAITGSPCGLYIVDNCMPNLPQYAETLAVFCQAFSAAGEPPYAEGCEIVVGCPVIREIPFPEDIDDRCFNYFIYNESVDCFVLVGGQGAGSGNLITSTTLNCGYCVEDGQTNWANVGPILSDPCAPGATLCLTGECCQNELVNSIQFVCQEFYEGLCATVISDLECEVGQPQYFTGGAFCFNLPTVTIQLT
jgi:hypothetical protein